MPKRRTFILCSFRICLENVHVFSINIVIACISMCALRGITYVFIPLYFAFNSIGTVDDDNKKKTYIRTTKMHLIQKDRPSHLRCGCDSVSMFLYKTYRIVDGR